MRHRGFRRAEGGTTAIEFAIVCLPLVLVCLGVIEFGRALNVRNDIAFAADFAARAILTNSAISDSALDQRIRAAFTGDHPDLLAITMETETADDVQFRTLTVSYPFTFVLPGLAESSITLGLSRRVPIG